MASILLKELLQINIYAHEIIIALYSPGESDKSKSVYYPFLALPKGETKFKRVDNELVSKKLKTPLDKYIVDSLNIQDNVVSIRISHPDDRPTESIVKTKEGLWKFTCSTCNQVSLHQEKPLYCPTCGLKIANLKKT